jgi:hypothetical protein
MSVTIGERLVEHEVLNAAFALGVSLDATEDEIMLANAVAGWAGTPGAARI